MPEDLRGGRRSGAGGEDDVTAHAAPSAAAKRRLGLTARDLRIAYGAVEAIHGVSLSVRPGTLTALVGANGAGKTTLLKGLMGLLPLTGGTVEVGPETGESVDIGPLPAHKVARHGVALVPEGREVLASMSVEENLETGGFLIRGRQARRARIQEVMARFPRLQERRTQLAGTLSGGEQQMLAIARALMTSPRLLLLDEPSLGLAPVIVRQVIEMIEGIRTDGSTILLVEQNTRIAMSLADYVYVLDGGRVAAEGTPAELESSQKLQSIYLGGPGARGGAREEGKT
jgi:branched-chain amino acid transport system ATP-binding protein